jgi:hypothetical protein
VAVGFAVLPSPAVCAAVVEVEAASIDVGPVGPGDAARALLLVPRTLGQQGTSGEAVRGAAQLLLRLLRILLMHFCCGPTESEGPTTLQPCFEPRLQLISGQRGSLLLLLLLISLPMKLLLLLLLLQPVTKMPLLLFLLVPLLLLLTRRLLLLMWWTLLLLLLLTMMMLLLPQLILLLQLMLLLLPLKLLLLLPLLLLPLPLLLLHLLLFPKPSSSILELGCATYVCTKTKTLFTLSFNFNSARYFIHVFANVTSNPLCAPS